VGKRITIHRPERLKYEPRPEKLKPKIPPRRAEFYADDVVWASEGPIRARYMATEEGVIDLQNERRPTEEVYSDHLTEEAPAGEHRHRIIRDAEGRVFEVRNPVYRPGIPAYLANPSNPEDPQPYRRAHGLPEPDAVPPNTALILDPGARPESEKRVHPWVRWKNGSYKTAWRAWQTKMPLAAAVQMVLLAVHTLVWTIVISTGYELLQILNL
jgi:hypothetical protein